MQSETEFETKQEVFMSKLILVVDDTPDLLEGLKEFLQMEDYRVLTATNGQEALDLLNDNSVDLVITDLLMPVMDGFKLIQIVKSQEIYQSLPIIVFSAKPRHENVDATLALGASKFVSKPSDLESILQSIKELTDEE